MKRIVSSILLGFVAVAIAFVLFKFSLYLAASRIYHVDECLNVSTARALATDQLNRCPANVSLFLVPFTWLAGGANQSADLFASARLLSLLIFWLNLILIALATGEKLLSGRGLIALMGAVTLAPLWDFGFEVRPENLLLTGLLLTWCVVRVGTVGMSSYFIAGALAVALQFTVREALVYTLPLALAIMVFPPPVARSPRWKLALLWAAGALAMFIAIRLLFSAIEFPAVYLAGSPASGWNDIAGERFYPWRILGRLGVQAPLLVALLAAALAAVVLDLRRRGPAALTWQGTLPEAVVILVALAGFIATPTPQPHDLAVLVPFAFLLGFRYANTIWQDLWQLALGRPLVFTLLLFAHLIPFSIATRRHLNWPNHRQDSLMRLAEELTHPTQHAVYDATGMVATRSGGFLDQLLSGAAADRSSVVYGTLSARPPAVFIRSYRTDGLGDEVQKFVRDRYVPLADDFFVLGKILPMGGGSFEVMHPGRYHIAPVQESNLAGTYELSFETLRNPPPPVSFTATLNGQPLTNRTVELSVGMHDIRTTPELRPTVVWAGPKSQQARQLGEADHLRLFVNWY